MATSTTDKKTSKKRSTLWVKLTEEGKAYTLSAHKIDEQSSVKIHCSHVSVIPVNEDYCVLTGLLHDLTDWDSDYQSKSSITLPATTPLPFELKLNLRDWEQRYQESTTSKYTSDAVKWVIERLKTIPTENYVLINFGSFDRESIEMAATLPEAQQKIIFGSVIKDFPLPAPTLAECEGQLDLLRKIQENAKNPKKGYGSGAGGKDYTPSYIKALEWIISDLKRLGIEGVTGLEDLPLGAMSQRLATDPDKLSIYSDWLDGLEILSKLLK